MLNSNQNSPSTLLVAETILFPPSPSPIPQQWHTILKQCFVSGNVEGRSELRACQVWYHKSKSSVVVVVVVVVFFFFFGGGGGGANSLW